MKKTLKIFSIIHAILTAALFTPGAVLFSWMFELHSYSRLLKTSLVFFPFILAAVLVINYFYPIDLRRLIQKKYTAGLAVCAAISLVVSLQASGMDRIAVSMLITTIFLFLSAVFFQKLHDAGRETLLLRLTSTILIIGAGVGLILFLYMSFYVRPYADDFCIANFVASRGLLNAMAIFYSRHGGRLFADLFMLGLGDARWLPFVEIAALIPATYLMVRMLRSGSGKSTDLWLISIALFLPFAVYYATTDPYKSLFWISNTALIFPVTLLMILFTGFMVKGLAAGFTHLRISAGAAFILASAIANAHEVVVPALILLCGVFLGAAVQQYKVNMDKSALVVTLAAVAGMVLGTVVLVAAPGNYVRKAGMGWPPAPALVPALQMSLGFFVDYLVNLSDDLKWAFPLIALFSGWLSDTLLPRKWRSAALVVVVIIGACWGAFFISTLVMSLTLPPRTQFLPTFFLCFGAYFTGAMLPGPKRDFSSIALKSSLILMCGLVFSLAIPRQAQLIPPLRQFARDWDARAEVLRSGSVDPYPITIPWETAEQPIGLNCMKEYFSNKQP